MRRWLRAGRRPETGAEAGDRRHEHEGDDAHPHGPDDADHRHPEGGEHRDPEGGGHAHGGDVPEHEHPHEHVHDDEVRLGFVGVGRVGTALAIAFRRAGWTVTAVTARERARDDRLQELLPGVHVFGEAEAILDQADVIFLTVPDDAISHVAGRLRLYSGQTLVHTSGLVPASVMAPAMAAGTAAASFHPLVAFAETESAIAALRGATVAIEGDERALPLLADLATSVGAQPVRIATEGKAAYHAAAMLAAGGLVALLDAIVRLGRGAGLDEAGALAVFTPLARQTLANAERLGVQAALTGPVIRGDVGTLRAHLDALGRLAPDARDVYRALAEREIALAAARGDLAEDGARALLALFPNPV